MLSMLRNLQPLILERTERMAFTIDITQDFFYQQGEKRGEKSKAFEIATNMLNEGFSIEAISRITELPAEEIEALWEKLQKGGKNKQ